MANYYVHEIPVQYVLPEQISENIHILLSELFFIRDLHPALPINVYSDTYDISYTTHTNKNIASAINKTIDEFRPKLLDKKKGRIVIGFYRVNTTRSLFGSPKKEKVYWEKWNFPYMLLRKKRDHTKAEERKLFSYQQDAIDDARLAIISNAQTAIDGMPPIPTQAKDLNNYSPKLIPLSISPIDIGPPMLNLNTGRLTDSDSSGVSETSTIFSMNNSPIAKDTVILNASPHCRKPSHAFNVKFFFGNQTESPSFWEQLMQNPPRVT